jgi:glutamate-1-semialdehyde 2,1-aminomutase
MSVSSMSADLLERAARHLPGGVNSNVRLDAPRIFFARGKGAWLWDVDGRDYVDYLLGQGPAFLGHAPEPVQRAVAEACAHGTVYGAQNPLEVEAAERLCEVLGWAEMVRFGMTGTEAVQAAIRLARAVTGRPRVVRFEGHYHGWLDNVLVASEPGGAKPASAGQLRSALSDSIVLPWNDLDVLIDALDREGEAVSAVLMEPAMLNTGSIAPLPGYLEGVRDLCSSRGIVLIFDEVITGFRLALGGAAERFGVIPDLAVYGKAMAGGWPVAAVVGPAELMERFGSGEVNHSGTFNGNVMAAAATIATLDLLRSNRPHERIAQLGASLMDELRALAEDASVPLRLRGFPVAFHASFGDGDVQDFRAVQALDGARYKNLAARLVDSGVWVAARGIWYLSVAHGEREVEVTLERAERALTAG